VTVLFRPLLRPFLQPAIRAILGEEWAPVGSYLAWMIVGVPMIIPVQVTTVAMLSARDPGWLLKIKIVTFALRIFPLSITAIWLSYTFQNR
jgi:O-antigen/teichoic acid export membrane protein